MGEISNTYGIEDAAPVKKMTGPPMNLVKKMSDEKIPIDSQNVITVDKK